MNLDVSFVAAASVLIAAIIPLYIYREKVFAFAYKSGNFDLFLQDLKKHMQKEHPKIRIEYSPIVDKTKNEKDIRIRQTLVVEDIVNQFFNYEYQKKTQRPVSKEKLWSSYMEFSKSNPNYPNDWSSRKELAYTRDQKQCNRCGTQIKLNEASTTFVKDIEDGGGYNLENIIILCADCNSILHSKNPVNTIHNLRLNDKLMFYVSN